LTVITIRARRNSPAAEPRDFFGLPCRGWSETTEVGGNFLASVDDCTTDGVNARLGSCATNVAANDSGVDLAFCFGSTATYDVCILKRIMIGKYVDKSDFLRLKKVSQ